MFYRWILTLSLFILEIIIVRTIEANSLRTGDTFSSKSTFPSAGVRGGHMDVDDEYSLVVRRGSDVLTSTQTQTGHYREITVTLTAFNETFILDLKLNTYLFASTYIEKAITKSGEVYNDVNHITGHCYYTGQVRNRSQSTAAVSTCKGITAYFAIGNLSYHIEPKGHDLYGRHRVFRDRDDVKSIFRCGTNRQLKWMSNTNSTSSFGRSLHRMKRSFLYPQDKDKVDKVVEVYVANDHSQYTARANDVNSVYSRTKDIINIASLAYQPLGIYLVLVGVEVWTDSNRFTIQDSNVSGALSSWYTYRQNSINPFHYNDNAVLINNVAFYSGIVGKAIVGSMCSYQYSGSVVSDLSNLPAAAGATLAHEMGHNFGLNHDDSISGCSCDDSSTYNRCIMYSITNSQRPATKWSTCSLTQFTTSFNQGLDICLYNIPQTIFQSSSTCGNGIVEDGEQCDCGKAPSSECSSTCCNTATCQLKSSASCSSGRCCDISSCQIKSSGTECRSKSNDCDLSESCNGVDARCPTDSYKPDGTDCTNIESAYCYQGQCRSHRSQCELIWGSGTQVSDNQCYTRFNTAAAHYGNCGVRWTNTGVTYTSCDAKDVLCGKLQCQDNSKALYYYQSYYLLSSASIGSYTCHSVIFDFGTGTQDPGLVPNGAKCGDRQMCVNQKCVSVTISPNSNPTTTTSTTRSTSSSTTTSTTTTTPTTTSTTTKSTTTTSTSTSSPTTTTTRPTSTSSTSQSSSSTSPTSTSSTSKSSSTTSTTSTSLSSTSSSKSSSSSSTTKKSTLPLPSSRTEWILPTTIPTFGTTEDSNSTADSNSTSSGVLGRLTGQQIGLIVGLTVGLVLGLLVLILLIILGYRYRRNMRNFFDKKLRFKSRPKPVAEVNPPAAADQNNGFENHGYISNERTPYDMLSPTRQAPRPMFEALSPARQAPAPPKSAFFITLQEQHNSVYSNFSEISTDQPWFSEDENPQPEPSTIYNNQAEVFNRHSLYPIDRPAVASSAPPQTPPKPQLFNHSPDRDETSAQVVLRNYKPLQLPVKPLVVAQSKGCTLLPPPKPQDLKPIPPSKSNGKVSKGISTTANKPPAVAIPPKPGAHLKPATVALPPKPGAQPKPQTIILSPKPGAQPKPQTIILPPKPGAQNKPPTVVLPPKPGAQHKPPTKPATAALNSNQTGGKGAVESSEEQVTLSVQDLRNQFGGIAKKPAVSASRSTEAQRKPKFSRA